MSLSSRNGGVRRQGAAGAIAAVATAAGAAWLLSAPVACFAAQIYYQPIVQLSTAYNTNVDLNTQNRIAAEGYYADASTVIGIATPNSETSLTPRLLYNYYPTVRSLNRLEGFLNLNSRYSWQRDRFDISGFFDHRDDVNAEQPAALDNPSAQGVGTTTPGTGLVSVGTTRNWLVLDPTFRHLITPLSAVGIGGEYQRLDYKPADTTGHVPFNYYLGRVFYAWTQNARTDFTVSAFGAKYLAGTTDATATTAGVGGDMKYNWTQTLQTDFSASYQRTQSRETTPKFFDQSSNQWAASLSTTYSGIASKYRASIGRTIIPGANGGLFVTDQLQAQYDRDITARLQFTGAVRYFRDRTANVSNNSDTRNYLTPFVRVQWMMTPRIFIAGAYNFIWEKYQASPTGAEASRVALTIGYTGLGRQR